MLDRPVSVVTGDSITGSIIMRRNSVWRRHMTITLSWNINSSTDDKCQASSVRIRGLFVYFYGLVIFGGINGKGPTLCKIYHANFKQRGKYMGLGFFGGIINSTRLL